MKVLKKVLLILVIIIVGLLVAAFFTEKNYAVEKEVTINQPTQQVFDYVKMLKNQDNFSKWASMDPNMKKTFTGTDGTVGFISAWESDVDDVGKGEQEIMMIDEGKRIEFELRFFEPFEAKDMAYITTEVKGAGTIVKWGFKGQMDYPMNLMLLFMDFEAMLGDDLQTGLDNLKNVLE